MELIELAEKLHEMYNTAPKGKEVAMIHVFGIKYHNEIQKFGATEVVKRSGISSKYYTEVRKGMNLSGFVDLKEGYR